ncbi:MAG: 30S ribosomal protein S10 [Elusimicrobiales bacterium]|jgi:small subunit ribosomal protein S10|nr:30S ribosomal protein S10 [Elusimicrobiales bacterium]NLH38520.1 30S ribosomal protein S10 [Elusimicrobiota bacterium]
MSEENTAGSKQIMRIKLESYDNALLDQSLSKIIEAVRRSGAIVSGPVFLPRKTRRYTVNRSVHADKKSREQFEIVKHVRLIDIVNSTLKTTDALSSVDLPSDVKVNFTLKTI